MIGRLQALKVNGMGCLLHFLPSECLSISVGALGSALFMV